MASSSQPQVRQRGESPYWGEPEFWKGASRSFCPSAPAPRFSPLPAGSMVTFSLLFPLPAEVTAATHSRYCCPRFRWAMR